MAGSDAGGAGDRGSASVVLVGVLVVVALVTAIAVGAVATLTDRARARAGADLAALAAALYQRERAVGVEGPAPCEMARRVALANDVRIAGCVIAADDSVTVTARAGTASASARAGHT